MMRRLQSSWMVASVGGLMYLAVTATLIKPAQFENVRLALEAAKSVARLEGPSWTYVNPEFDQWVEEIRVQKENLAVREQQLQDLQTRLKAERQELNNATQIVHQLQAEFDKYVLRIRDQEADNLKRQAKVLAGMSPEGAAGLINEMPEDEAVRILVTMKPDEASAVLETMAKSGKADAKRAATFTEKMRRTLPPESASRARNPS